MYLGYAPRKAHAVVSGLIAILTVALYTLNNMNLLSLLVLFPAYAVWGWRANDIGRRRLIRLATGSSRGWRSTSIRNKIDGKSAQRIIRAVARAKRRRQSIAVFVNSPGGDFAATLTIIDALKAHDDQVVFIILDRCMSAATIITCAFPQSDRFAVPNSRFMIHGASASKPTRRANSEHLEKARTWISEQIQTSEHQAPAVVVNGLVATTTADGSDLPTEFLAILFATGGELYFSAQDACKVGLVGTIINPF